MHEHILTDKAQALVNGLLYAMERDVERNDSIKFEEHRAEVLKVLADDKLSQETTP